GGGLKGVRKYRRMKTILAAIRTPGSAEMNGRISRKSLSEMNASYQARYNSDQLAGVNRVGYIHLETCGQRPHAVFIRGDGRDRHGRDLSSSLWSPRTRLSDQIVSVLIRHGDV